MGITTESFRRKCEEKMQEGNAFIGIAYDDMRSFLFLYTGKYSLTLYHYEYNDKNRFGRETVIRESTYDKWLYEAIRSNAAKYRDLVTWEETVEGKARKGDITKLRKHIEKLARAGRLNLLVEYDGKSIIDERGGVFNV